MKNILLLLMMTLFIVSCQKEDIESPPVSANEESTLSINLISDAMEQTRALNSSQERTVNNVNIYCFHNASGLSKHLYLTNSTSTSLSLIHGDWTIYVIANLGYNMGTKTKSEIDDFRYTISGEGALESNSVLVMSGSTNITVSGNRTISLALYRAVAKVDVSVSVSSALISTIKVKSIRMVNAPISSTLFRQNVATTQKIAYAERSCTNGTATSFYVLENAQGSNNAITNQKYKGGSNAPANATYIHIKAETTTEKIDYYIYPGANNTTDFNILRNKNYIINITINGINETDWRVSVTDIPQTISANLSYAYYKDISYIPVQPGVGTVHAGIDRDITVTVNLSKASKYDVQIGVLGAYIMDGMNNLYVNYNSTNGLGERLWATDYLVTIPAGAITATKKLSTVKFRQGGMLAGFPSPTHCLIKEIVRSSNDLNTYTITSGNVPFTNTVEYVKTYPPN